MVRRGSWSRRLLASDLEAVGLDADDVIAAMGRRSLVKGYPTKNGDALYLPDALWEAGVRSLFPDGDEGLATTAWGMAMHKVRHTEERQQVADALCPFLALGWRLAMVGIGGDTLWAQLALDEDAARSREVPYHSGLLAVCLGVGMSPPPFSVGPADVGCVWVVGNDDTAVDLSGRVLPKVASVWFVPRAASGNDAAWILVRGGERRPLR
jgi:hypothetical protein